MKSKGILKKSSKPASAVLDDEVKRMEARLEELKGFMATEKEKRASEQRSNDASRWRSGTSKFRNTNNADNPTRKPNPVAPKQAI
jgi:hypothetical protein